MYGVKVQGRKYWNQSVPGLKKTKAETSEPSKFQRSREQVGKTLHPGPAQAWFPVEEDIDPNPQEQ